MFPSKPIIVEEDWQKIIQYYVTNAPEKALPQPKKEPVNPQLLHFNAKNRAPTEGGVLPLITMVKMDTVRHLLYINDIIYFCFNKRLNIILTLLVKSAHTYLTFFYFVPFKTRYSKPERIMTIFFIKLFKNKL
jgi:hypothetical protein